MTLPVNKLDREIEKVVFDLARKYGFNDICITGSINPKYYKTHKKLSPSAGLVISFIDEVIR